MRKFLINWIVSKIILTIKNDGYDSYAEKSDLIATKNRVAELEEKVSAINMAIGLRKNDLLRNSK